MERPSARHGSASDVEPVKRKMFDAYYSRKRQCRKAFTQNLEEPRIGGYRQRPKEVVGVHR